MQVRAWDTTTGLQVKKMAEHDSFVNTCCPLRRGPPLVVSGSDDGTAKASDDAGLQDCMLVRVTLSTMEWVLGHYPECESAEGQVWDMRVKRSVQTLPEKYQVCSAAFADAGDQVLYPSMLHTS